MEITQAINLLQEKIQKIDQEKEILALSLAILSDNFRPQLTAFTSVTTENNNLKRDIQKKQTEIQEKTQELYEKNIALAEKDALIREKDDIILEKESKLKEK